MKGLGDDQAVKTVGRYVVSTRQIAHDRGLRIAGVDIEDVDVGHLAAAEPTGVGGVAYFEDVSCDHRSVLLEKALDIVAINWKSSVVTEVTAQRFDTSQGT